MTQQREDVHSPEAAATGGALARFFDFGPLGTNARREILAGVTTFVTMAYILIVNPDILSNAIFLEEPRDLFGELVMATGLSAAIATLIMGLYAKLPFALAPGMGINAYFAFAVVLGIGVDWRIALAAVFIEGLIFIVLTVSGLRNKIVEAIPESVKHATTAGIGLFIAYIALSGSGIIVANDATLTGLGDLQTPTTAVTVLGILITSALFARRVTGALLWGILATSILAWIFGVSPWPSGFFAVPQLPVDLFGQAFVGLEIGRAHV